MSSTVEIIGVPLDLGANIRGSIMGPAAIRIADLKRRVRQLNYEVVDSGDLQVPVRESLSPEEVSSHYLETISKLCEDLAKRVLNSLQLQRTPLVLGGDHSVAMGTISGVSQYYQNQKKNLGVIWIDAHADMNSPETSPSGNIHGMPLAALLGKGHERLTELVYPGSKLKPENVALIGIRNIDGIEKEAVRNSGVHYYSMRQIDELGMYRVTQEAIEKVSKHSDALHLSLDMDGVDPLYAPGVSTPVSGGLSYREVHLALEMIADTKKLVSMEFVELNPYKDIEHKTANLVVELVLSALGKSIV